MIGIMLIGILIVIIVVEMIVIRMVTRDCTFLGVGVAFMTIGTPAFLGVWVAVIILGTFFFTPRRSFRILRSPRPPLHPKP